ncbi:hypothetical protein BXZ70DRAFT_1066491 [Cristinia sonorae]|uniref:Uncharacterized protein n=1 Tax=Cristinia sonorae TaxID=1940300 RepID=A0A8K0UK24_9AGAR|nr:hypothetical protein BXZ70DRAFT_1066491 [Cristinia sonorae]
MRKLAASRLRWQEMEVAAGRVGFGSGISKTEVVGIAANRTKKKVPSPEARLPPCGVPWRRYLHCSKLQVHVEKQKLIKYIKDTQKRMDDRVARTLKFLQSPEGTITLKFTFQELMEKPMSIGDAHAKCLKMLKDDYPVQEQSCLVQTSDKVTLFVYTSWHLEKGKAVEDSISQTVLNRFEANMRHMFDTGKTIPTAAERERHPNDSAKFMEYRDHLGKVHLAMKSIQHWFEMWQEEGWAHREEIPSRDLLCGGDYEEFWEKTKCMLADDEITYPMRGLLKSLFPEQYQRMDKSFKRITWAARHVPLPRLPPGPFAGRVTLNNLQTVLHKDSLDELCVVFNTGKYIGGEFLSPDTGIKFKYAPGHTAAFLSQYLWHAVAPWKPATMEPEDLFPPGRISRVYTTHRRTIKKMLLDNYKTKLDKRYTLDKNIKDRRIKINYPRRHWSKEIAEAKKGKKVKKSA